MIYANFLYFIIVIMIFSVAPLTKPTAISFLHGLIGLLLVFIIFWFFNKFHFERLRKNVDHETIDFNQARKGHMALINFNIIIAIALFILEIFYFDLKVLLVNLPLVGGSRTLVNIIGITVFFLHLSIIWYWAFRSVGKVLQIADSTGEYVWENIRFNLVIVAIWLVLSLIGDILIFVRDPWLLPLMDSVIFQLFLFAVFIFLLLVFAPVLITFLWKCKSLPESDLKDTITAFARSQGVKFKKIMSWNALSRGLITAGVIGIFPYFRYLLITPRLMELLDKDEILAVASHEIGHVKKKHLIFYFLFFLLFVVPAITIIDWLVNLFLFRTSLGLSFMISADGLLNDEYQAFFQITLFVLFFIFYFRFVFSYFMRNFERQADLFCFQVGIDPAHMISSFMKLGVAHHDDGKRTNWHHFTIPQRIDFLRRCEEKPEMVNQHKKKLNRSLVIFILVMISLILLTYSFRLNSGAVEVDLNLFVNNIHQKIQKDPENPGLYKLLGLVYYEMKKWRQSKRAYEISLKLNYNQPEILNNLAWLLLKSGDKDFYDPKRALRLVRDAVELKETHYNLDTLAEAYHANGMYKEAFLASKRALEALKTEANVTGTDRVYLKKQLERMKKAYLNKSSIKI